MKFTTLLKLRLGQRGYWNAVMIVAALRSLLILAIWLAILATPGRTLPSWVFYMVFVWISLDLWPTYAWRMHDLGRSGWTAGPLLFGVAMLCWMGFTGLLSRAVAGAGAPAWTTVAQFGLIAAPLGAIAFTIWLGLQKGDPDENRFKRGKLT